MMLLKRSLRVAFLTLGLLSALGLSSNSIAQDQTINGDLILEGDSPTLILNKNTGFLRKWELRGQSGDFVLFDATALTSPVIVDGDAPNSSLSVDETGRIGFGLNSPLANLHVATESPSPTLRLEGTNGSFQSRWDLISSTTGLILRNDLSQKDPFVILGGAPTSSFVVAENGSIGMGTLTPNSYASGTNLNGKFFNLSALGSSAATGIANGIFQGNLGAQNHLVHLGAPVDQKIMRMQCSSGFFGLHVLTDNTAAKAVADCLSVKMSNGNVGLRVQNPAHPLHLVSGAHCSAGGVWTNACSRDLKENIRSLSSEQARDAVRAMQPVEYSYKSEPGETYVGFIAEDVPELVATNSRKSLSPLDVTAVLTKVVQDQDKQLSEQRTVIEKLTRRLEALEQKSAE